jgi:hypothetical protein
MKPQNLILIPVLITCLALAPKAQAVVPAPDGGYPGGNTAEGQASLLSLTSGTYNTAVGLFSLKSNTEGSFNTALGAGTLLLSTGNENTATGAGALLSNTTGIENTANGTFALFGNTTGSYNTANGYQALFNNTISGANTAVGYRALQNNTTDGFNTAIGDYALGSTTGSNNTAIGSEAGSNITGSNNIDIGNNGVGGESSTIRIGDPSLTATYIAGIAGQTVGAGGTTCYVDNDGKLGVFLSARRFKTNIADMGAASEALLALRPVTFRYKPELDKTGIPQFGLVAEEVAQVNPDLVTHDAKGDICTVRYEAVNAMLLNEFLKEHKQLQEQEATILELKSTVAQQLKDFETTISQQQNTFQAKLANQEEQIEALASDLQKVNAQIEVRRPAPQAVCLPAVASREGRNDH